MATVLTNRAEALPGVSFGSSYYQDRLEAWRRDGLIPARQPSANFTAANARVETLTTREPLPGSLAEQLTFTGVPRDDASDRTFSKTSRASRSQRAGFIADAIEGRIPR